MDILHYTRKSMLYYLLLAVAVYLLHAHYGVFHLHWPFTTLTALSLTIETNLKEQWGDKNSPPLNDYPRGVVL